MPNMLIKTPLWYVMIRMLRKFIACKTHGSLGQDDLKGTILDTVHEKDEHGGFLRGVGGHVDRSSYKRFGTTNELYVDQQSEIMSMKMRIAKLEAALSLPRGGADLSIPKGSCSVFQPELEPTQEGRSPDHVEDQPVAISPDQVCTIDADTHMVIVLVVLCESLTDYLAIF